MKKIIRTIEQREPILSQRIVADHPAGRFGVMLHLPVIATEPDNAELMPGRRIPHDQYLHHVSTAAATAAKEGLPVLLKEFRAVPYREWLARHQLADVQTNRFLYSSFAPAVRDSAMRVQLGLSGAEDIHIFVDSDEAAQDPEDLNKAEKKLIRMAIANSANDPFSILPPVIANAVSERGTPDCPLLWTLASKLADGMPERPFAIAVQSAKHVVHAWAAQRSSLN